MIKKFIKVAAVFFLTGSAMAQGNMTIPSIQEMEGEYIIINSKEYEGTKHIAEMKAMNISLTTDDSLSISGFYMSAGKDIKVGYNPTNGSVTIPAGTLIFAWEDGGGTKQYLYAWDEARGEVIFRPITFHYDGNNTWSTDVSIVLMTGVDGGELSPYYFSQGSEFHKANACTKNLSYVGFGEEQQKWDESRPSYVVINGNKINIYNLLQKDQYGYGCQLELMHDPNNGMVASNPVLIGEATDFKYAYKALTGCVYDEAENKPTGSNNPGTPQEGMIQGTFDMERGVIELGPMAIWPSKYEANGWIIDLSRFYEFVKSVEIILDPALTTSISAPENIDIVEGEIERIEYWNMVGQKINAPTSGDMYIRKIYYKNKTFKTEKFYLK